MDSLDTSLPKAWPFEEAQKLALRAEEAGKREVLFETGYGPSGLPHIGTFGGGGADQLGAARLWGADGHAVPPAGVFR